MGKKKDKAAKAKKTKLPKEIAGVKIPKTLRKRGEAAIEMVQSPAGRELIATGLIAAGTAIAAKAISKSASKSASKPGCKDGAAAGKSAKTVVCETRHRDGRKKSPEELGEAIGAMISARLSDALERLAAKTKPKD